MIITTIVRRCSCPRTGGYIALRSMVHRVRAREVPAGQDEDGALAARHPESLERQVAGPIHYQHLIAADDVVECIKNVFNLQVLI